MNTRLTILQLVRNLDIGGAQEVVSTLAAYLERAGHRVVVATLEDGPLRSDLEDQGISVTVLPARRHSVMRPPGFVRDTRRFRANIAELASEHSVDVIQTHLLRSLDFVVASLRSVEGRPSVWWTFHNVNFTLRREHLGRQTWLLRPKLLAYRVLYRWLARRVAGIVAVSDEVRSAVLDYLRCDPDLVTVIPNGVDVSRYDTVTPSNSIREDLGVPGSGRLAIMVGTFKEQKGHRVLIEAMSAIAPDHPELRAALVGDGELVPVIQRQIDDSGVGESVRILGRRRDVPRLLAAADLFVLPSLWEGLPMALLEAMASGLPCIATRVSGSQRVIEPGVSGILVEPGDADELEEAIRYVLADEDRATRMGTAARQRIEALYGAEKQAKDHIAVYRAALGSRG